MFGANKYSNIMGIKDPGKNLGSAASAVGIASGVSNLMGGDSGSGGGANSATPGGSVYDPFASQRPQYQNQLQTLMQNPGSFASSPAYQFAFGQGLDAVNRTEAAKGMLGSGNRLYDLTKYGQGLAGQQYFQQAGLLSNLSGSGSGGFNIAGGGTTQQGWNALGQGLGGLQNTVNDPNSMLNSWLGGGSTGFGTDTGGSGYNVGGDQGAMLSSQWGM